MGKIINIFFEFKPKNENIVIFFEGEFGERFNESQISFDSLVNDLNQIKKNAKILVETEFLVVRITNNTKMTFLQTNVGVERRKQTFKLKLNAK